MTATLHAERQDRSTVRSVADPANRPAAKEPGDLTPERKAALDRDFDRLYRDHLRDVYSFAYYRVGNHHDAEDLTEQAFLQAYRHFDRAQRESDGRSLRPWLIRIVQNLADNYYRARARKPQASIDLVEPIAAPVGSDRIAEDREELDQLMRLIRELPDERREALIMRFALGMDNAEIARAMGRSNGATKVLLHRAVKQLEEMVATEAVPGGAE
jgi:RNA polymerase sigma-70 factor (ECF subfamily)